MSKKKVGIWIRVSTEDQKQGDSPEHHRERAKMYAQIHNYEVTEVYDLAGVSGKTVKDHPEARRMLNDIKQGHITGLIFSKIARFARNTRELLDFADFFKQYNADLISLEESFDTSTPAGRLFFTFISAIGEWEREELVSRINSSVKVRAKLGKRLGGKSPYGYRWEGHNLILHPEEAEIRKLIYTLFIQEQRKKTVARILNERGYRTRSGSKFCDTNIKRWLRDPLSKGLRRSNFTKKVLIDGKEKMVEKDENEWFFHEAPAIVSEKVWQRANDILDKQEQNRKPLNYKTHLFTRYIFCACGSSMSVRSGYGQYRCYKTGCNNKIKKEVIEAIYKEQLLNYVQDKNKIAEYLKVSDSTLNDKKKLLDGRKKKKEELEERIEKIIALHIDNQISKEAFRSYHDQPYEELQEVKQEILQLETEIQATSMEHSSVEMVVDSATSLYTNWDNFKHSQKRKLIEMITERITIGKDDQIHIKLYRLMPDDHFSELETNGQHNHLVTKLQKRSMFHFGKIFY